MLNNSVLLLLLLFYYYYEVRIAVGLRLESALGLPHSCHCGKEIDALGLHCFTGKRGSGKQMRHNLLNETVIRSLHKARIQARMESLGLCRNETGTTHLKRPDGVTIILWRSGRCVTWDVTVADTYAASYLGETSLLAGAAAERAASRKKREVSSSRRKLYFHSVGLWGCWHVVWSRFCYFRWFMQKNFWCNWWLQWDCLFVSEAVYCHSERQRRLF